MSQTNPRHSPALWHTDVAVALVLAAITALCWLGAVKPVLSQSSQNVSARQQLEQVRGKAAESSRSLAAAQSAVAHTRAALDTYNQPCWSETDRSRRLEWLYSVAQAAGLKIETVEPGEAETISNRKGIGMRLSARGTYAAVTAAVHDLRLAMPDVLLRGMDLTALPGAEVPEMTVALDLVWIPVTTPGEHTTKVTPASEASIREPAER